MASLTAHCLVKNEENFIRFSIGSVINYVDKVLVFDTGSSDKTIEIINELVLKHPHKIIFEEKGECDKIRHTALRQEMVDCTTTDWFMVLDGDEVWTDRGMTEVLSIIKGNKPEIECLIAPFYLCVGDVYHYSSRGLFEIMGRLGHLTPRLFKKIRGANWRGVYEQDSIYDQSGNLFFNKKNTFFLKNKFWHLTHLQRSSFSNDYSSGGTRQKKFLATYFILGKKIKEILPEVFAKDQDKFKMSLAKSFFNFWPLAVKKIINKFKI
ncbi:MAG: glycosyltransferase [bacterium]